MSDQTGFSPRIEFHALVGRITTTVDGGYKITFDLPEYELEAVTQLIAMKARGGLLRINAEWAPEGDENEEG